MTAVDPDRVLGELALLRTTTQDPELDAVRTALLVEDVWGIALTDSQITPAVLCDTAALRGLVTGSAPEL